MKKLFAKFKNVFKFSPPPTADDKNVIELGQKTVPRIDNASNKLENNLPKPEEDIATALPEAQQEGKPAYDQDPPQENILDTFDIKCSICKETLPLQSLINSIISFGYITLIGYDSIWFGFNCPQCQKGNTSISKYSMMDFNPFMSALWGILNVEMVYNSFPYEFKKEQTDAFGKKPFFQRADYLKGTVYLQEIDENYVSGPVSPPGLYCSYDFTNPVTGPAVAGCWYQEKYIEKLAEIESKTHEKMFPRTIVYDPIYWEINMFYLEYFSEISLFKSLDNSCTVTEILSSSPKKEMAKLFDFMHILDFLHISKTKLYLPKGGGMAVSNMGISKGPLGTEPSTARKLSGTEHEKLSEEVWANFTKPYMQDLLRKMAGTFIKEYIELMKSTTASFESLWNLKERYLCDLHGTIKSRHKRKMVEAKTKKAEFLEVQEAEKSFPGVKIISRDSKINQIKIKISRIAKLISPEHPVLLLGERGTGKQLFAEAIHEASGRQGPFEHVNCGGFNDQFVESTLFGYVKGAFTGAVKDNKGAFEKAAGGTIFLDEIGNLPLNQQAKLLLVLEQLQYEPIGAEKKKNVEALIVLATNRDLDEMASKGEFMPDLYDRFSSHSINIPPLRERKGDIPLLVNRFMDELDEARKSDPSMEPIPISQEIMEILNDYSWDGNVRPLKGLIEKIMFNREKGLNRFPVTIDELDSKILHSTKPYKHDAAPKIPEKKGRIKYPPELILSLMEKHHNNKSHVAKELECSWNTVHRACLAHQKKCTSEHSESSQG